VTVTVRRRPGGEIECPDCGRTRAVCYETARKVARGHLSGRCQGCAASARVPDGVLSREALRRLESVGELLDDNGIREWAARVWDGWSPHARAEFAGALESLLYLIRGAGDGQPAAHRRPNGRL
jgi:hypothetical protein